MKLLALVFALFAEYSILIAQDIILPFRENDNWYYVTEDRTRISSIVYQEAYPFGLEFAVVKKNDKYGFINKSEEIVIPCQYDYAKSEFSLLHVAVGTDTFWIDQNGNRSTKLYNDVMSISKSRITKTYTKNGKTGVVSIYGDTILPAKYHLIEITHNGAIIARNNDEKIGIFNESGELTIPFELDSFRLNNKFNPKFICIFSDGKVGAISLKGDLIGLPRYENIYYDNDLIYTILKNGKKGYLYNGVEYWSDEN